MGHGLLGSLDFVFKLSYKSESCIHINQNFDETAVFDSGKILDVTGTAEQGEKWEG